MCRLFGYLFNNNIIYKVDAPLLHERIELAERRHHIYSFNTIFHYLDGGKSKCRLEK